MRKLSPKPAEINARGIFSNHDIPSGRATGISGGLNSTRASAGAGEEAEIAGCGLGVSVTGISGEGDGLPEKSPKDNCPVRRRVLPVFFSFSFGAKPVTGGNNVVGRGVSIVRAVFPVFGFFFVEDAAGAASNGRIGWMTILFSLRLVRCVSVSDMARLRKWVGQRLAD